MLVTYANAALKSSSNQALTPQSAIVNLQSPISNPRLREECSERNGNLWQPFEAYGPRHEIIIFNA